jgi:hypothetical protein
MIKKVLKEKFENVTKINVFHIPEIGDIVFDKDGNEGTCTDVIHLWHGSIFQIFDGEKYGTLNEDPFKSKVLMVKKNNQ